MESKSVFSVSQMILFLPQSVENRGTWMNISIFFLLDRFFWVFCPLTMIMREMMAFEHTCLSMIRGVDFFKNTTVESSPLQDTRQYHPLRKLVVYLQ